MAAERPLDVVKASPRSVPQRPATFAQHVQQVLETCDDVASEQCWQDFSRVIVTHWDELSQSQPPAQTWSMMARATETIVKLRRGQQHAGQSASDALEEFRAFMNDVVGKDDQA